MPVSLRHFVRWIGICLVAACMGLGALATAFPLMAKKQGMNLVTLTGGSMAPAYAAGETIKITKPESVANLKPGAVITFMDPNRRLVTHRIVEKVTLGDKPGAYFRTRGDANNAPDPDLVPAGNVVGVVASRLTGWERLATDLQQPQVRLFIFGVPLVVVAIQQSLLLVAAFRSAMADFRTQRAAESLPETMQVSETTPVSETMENTVSEPRMALEPA